MRTLLIDQNVSNTDLIISLKIMQGNPTPESQKRNYEIFVKSYISPSFYIIGSDPGCPILGVPGLFTTRIC